MKFKTQYNFKDDIVSCPGTLVEEVDKTTGEKINCYGRRYTYEQKYDDKGIRYLAISGTEDVYNSIQSYKDDVDIYKILKRLNGDLSQLDSNKGFYADVADVPRDINEFYNKIEEGKNIFASLPTDFKERFGNSVNEFMTSIYNKDFEEKLIQYYKDTNSHMFVNDNISADVKVEKGVDNE